MIIKLVKYIQLFSIFTFVFFVSSCSQNNKKLDLTEDQKIDIKIYRFDSTIIYLNTNDLQMKITKISSQFPDFYNIFFSDILGYKANDTIGITNGIKQYISDSTYKKVNIDVMKLYKNIHDIEIEISSAFSIYKYYFSDINIPKVYFFVSGFNRSIYFNDKIIAIGTDMYLGQDYPLYNDLAYQYTKYGMQRKFIAVDVVSTMLFNQFTFDSKSNRLIDNMLYRGKVMYLLSVLLSERTDADIIGYTQEQVEWNEKYEKEIWGAMIDQKHIFSTDAQLIRKYMNDAPFTAPISQESPGRLGMWIGYKIIKSYMQNNKNISIPDLMSETDYQSILQKSNYRP